MPWGDRTGPWGLGPMTGRAVGYCAGYPVPGYMNPIPGFGRDLDLVEDGVAVEDLALAEDGVEDSVEEAFVDGCGTIHNTGTDNHTPLMD